MNNHSNIYVKINYELDDTNSTEVINGAHVGNNNTTNSPRYLIAGGIYNKKRGSMLFNARNIEEAESIANNNRFANYEVVIQH